jgi:hypothetical protein
MLPRYRFQVLNQGLKSMRRAGHGERRRKGSKELIVLSDYLFCVLCHGCLLPTCPGSVCSPDGHLASAFNAEQIVTGPSSPDSNRGDFFV